MICKEAVNIYVDYLLYNEKKSEKLFEQAEKHIKSCDKCKEDFSFFSKILDKYSPQLPEGEEIIPCSQCEKYFSSYLQKKLKEPEQKDFEKHLIYCKRCLEKFTEFALDLMDKSPQVYVKPSKYPSINFNKIYREFNQEEIIAEIFEKVKKIRTFPECIQELLAMLEDIETPMPRLERCIKRDPVIAAGLLKIANSAFYAARMKISTIPHAVMVIGFRGIRELIIALSFLKKMKKFLKGYGIKRDEFLNYIIFSANCSAFLFEQFKSRLIDKSEITKYNPESLYTAGLLRDIGMIVLDEFIEKHKKDIFQQSKYENIKIAQIEKTIIGVDHGLIGTKVLHKWYLPPFLIDGIKNHHNPLDAESDSIIAKILYLIDTLISKVYMIPYLKNNVLIDIVPEEEICNILHIEKKEELENFYERLQAILAQSYKTLMPVLE